MNPYTLLADTQGLFIESGKTECVVGAALLGLLLLAVNHTPTGWFKSLLPKGEAPPQPKRINWEGVAVSCRNVKEALAAAGKDDAVEAIAKDVTPAVLEAWNDQLMGEA